MQWLASFSEITDAVSRLGLSTSQEVPMEISALPPHIHVSVASQTQYKLERLLRAQEHIMMKLAKIEASQSHKHRYDQSHVGQRHQRPIMQNEPLRVTPMTCLIGPPMGNLDASNAIDMAI